MEKIKQVNNLLRKILPILLLSSLVLSGSIMVFSKVSVVAAADSGSSGTFVIDGDVANPIRLSVSDLQTMPQTVVTADLKCGGLLVTNGEWTGVKLTYLLQLAGADPKAANIDFHASDGYAVTFGMGDPIDDYFVGYMLNGEFLTETFRLVLPGQNGGLWISMITEIAITGGDTYNNYLTTPTGPSITGPPTPSTTPTSTPIAPPTTTTPSVTPTETPAQTASPEPTPAPSASVAPSSSASPVAQPTQTTPPTTTAPTAVTPSPVESTQPANDSGLAGQQGQPNVTTAPISGSGFPLIQTLALGIVAVVAVLAAALVLVLRRRDLAR